MEWREDPGGEGFETAKEILSCRECFTLIGANSPERKLVKRPESGSHNFVQIVMSHDHLAKGAS